MPEYAETRDLSSISVPRPADVFAETLRQKIFSGELAEGSMLPAERQLVEESGLTRSAVRDGLAQLQREGLIVVKTGRRGGSIVTRPTASEVVRSMELNLEGWAPEADMLVESRLALEPWCAYYAAERRTDEDLRVLRDLNERASELVHADGPGDFAEYKMKWHAAVARASRNEVMAAMLEALSRAIFRQFDDSLLHGQDSPSRERSLRRHREITEAIAARQAERAFTLMSGHLDTRGALNRVSGVGAPD